MDYLDPKKAQAHRILLFAGYICIAVAIVLTSLVLVYQAYGFGIGKNGTVIQNGLVFFSSQPSPATIYVNGTRKNTTNTRLVLPEGIYHVDLKRDGYFDWQRKVEVNGGSVEHFDYPFLIPKTLTTKKLQPFDAVPSLVTQSLDRRWLVVRSGSGFQLYDLKTPTKSAQSLAIPDSLVTKAIGTENWQAVEWADDNQHVLVRHAFDGKVEYLLLDRSSPAQSINLSNTLTLGTSQVSLRDKKYDQYYLYDQSTSVLQTATLKTPKPTTLLEHVAAFKSYGRNSLLYATDLGEPSGSVAVKFTDGTSTNTIRSLPASSGYLLDIASYSGAPYVIAGTKTGDRVYIYKDPVAQLKAAPDQKPTPVQVLHLKQPNYAAFSASAQFVVVENGQQFAVYDIENKAGHSYTATEPLDAPQPHAVWMDGNRLTYVSGGKLQLFDYDHTNQHSLVPASASYLPVFAPDYKYTYVVATDAGQTQLTQVALRAPADL